MIPKYLVQHGTGRVYPFKERLMRRGDCIPCDENGKPTRYRAKEVPGTPEHDQWRKEKETATGSRPEADAVPAQPRIDKKEIILPPAEGATKGELLDFAANKLELHEVSDQMTVPKLKAVIKAECERRNAE